MRMPVDSAPAASPADTVPAEAGKDFIRDIIQGDLDAGVHKSVVTRFPPEPNGYLHIGHAKSICLNFGVAQEFGGRCHLRFDDTNPAKEEQEYIDAIERDVRWLGFDWGTHLHHASDYFEQLYAWAEHLISVGKAYIDDQSADDMRASRGTLTEPGKNSPFRDRSVEENLDLFRRMRKGEFPNGARVLCSIASSTRPIRARARRGASIRTTISRMVSRTRSSTSRIRSAPSNSKTTSRSMSGCWTTCRCPPSPSSTSSRG
jgi:hypothetical protein